MNNYEIDITEFYQNVNPCEFSNSIANSGNPNIGAETWNNAKNSSWHFVTEENRETFLNFFLSFGAWEKEEIDTIDELNALFIQYVSGDINEHADYDLDTEAGREEMEQDMEDGRISSRIFYPWQTVDNRIYFYIGE